MIGILHGYLLLFLVGTTYVLFKFRYHADELFYYHLFVLAGGTFASIYSLRFSKTTNEKPSDRLWPSIVTIFAGLLFYGLNTWQSYADTHLWLDEYSQIMNSGRTIYADIFGSAANEQQPAGGYIVTALLGDLIGHGKLSAKLMGFIPMLISLAIFQLVFFRTKGFFYFSVLLSLFYTFDYDVRYLSMEGRPVGLAVMALSFCALALKMYLLDHSKKALITFGLCVYLFLFSVGMQPVFLMFCFGLASVILVVKDHKKHKEAFWIGLAILVPTLFFLPIQLYIFEAAEALGQIKGDRSQAFNNWVNNWSLKNYLYFFYSNTMGGVWSLGVFILALIFSFKDLKNKSTLFKVIFLGLIIWIPAFESFYNLTVAWGLRRWYFSCFYILSTVLALYLICRQSNKWFKYFTVVLALVMLFKGNTAWLYHKETKYRQDWQGLYHRFVKEHNPDRIYVFGQCDLYSFWCWDIFVGAGLFDKHENNYRTRVYADLKKTPFGQVQDNGFVYDTLKVEQNLRVSAVIPSNKNVCPESRVKGPENELEIQCEWWNKFTMITSQRKINLKDEGGQFLEYLYTAGDALHSKFFINIMLVNYYSTIGRMDEAKKWYAILKEKSEVLQKVKRGELGHQFFRDIERLVKHGRQK